jgi:hypothetical protein
MVFYMDVAHIPRLAAFLHKKRGVGVSSPKILFHEVKNDKDY